MDDDLTLLLLDVDGVLNPLDPRGPQPRATGFTDWERVPPAELPPLWSQLAIIHRSPTQLAIIAALPACEIVWATTWGDLAHPAFGGGTPVRRHIEPRPSKKSAVAAFLAALPAGRRVVWIDDDLRPGGPLVGVDHGDAAVTRVPTDPHVGLSRDLLERVRNLLNGGPE